MATLKSKIALIALLLSLPGLGLAHESSIGIAGPYDGQIFVTDSLPLSIQVDGTISHSAPPNGANVADSQACVSLNGGTPVCQPAPVSAGKPPSSYNYLVSLAVNSPGFHTLQAFTSKTDGGHAGQSDVITIEVVLLNTTCDEVDPPAYANQYLNELNLPSEYATYRGQIIKFIANNHSNNVYGSCHYDYAAVTADVDALLSGLPL